MKSDVHQDWGPLKTTATSNRPAHGVYVWLLVEVVAVLADVVQRGVDGGVIPPPALVRHPAVPLTTDNSYIDNNSDINVKRYCTIFREGKENFDFCLLTAFERLFSIVSLD